MQLYTDFDTLIGAVHAHVHKAGVGRCEVVLDDDPMTLRLGYRVVEPTGEEARYQIRLTSFKQALPKWGKLGEDTYREAVAETLTRGEMPTPENLRR